MRKLIIIFMIVSVFMIINIVNADDFCCLTPYYCEEFDNYNDAHTACEEWTIGQVDWAVNYSCSHKENSVFCKSCCELDGNKYTVYDKNDCVGGVIYFQNECEESTHYIEGQIIDDSTNEPLVNAEIEVQDTLFLSNFEGRFSIPIEFVGSINLKFRVDQLLPFYNSMYIITDEKITNIGLVNIPNTRVHAGYALAIFLT